MDANSDIDPASEKLIIEIPATRGSDEPGHTGGGLDFDVDGNLLIGVGDDVNPHSEPSGGYAPLSERTTDPRLHDARATSANTNDLRGKLLRVNPSRTDAAGYTIPAGNMFDEAAGHGGQDAAPRSTRWASATRSGSRSTRTRAGSASPTTRPTPARTRRPRAARRASSSGT